MSKIENYLGIANYDIQIANNSQELKSYVASILCENDELQQENNQLKAEKQEWINLLDMFKNQQKEFISYLENCINELKKESMNELQNAINLGIVDITKEILSKYKEIIGDKDEDNIGKSK